MRQRPQNFLINQGHELARGLVFAGLGGLPGTTHYHDSSLHGNAGTLTNMTPADDWVWVDELGRWGLDFNGSSDRVSKALPTQSWDKVTLAAFGIANVSGAQRLFNVGNVSELANYYAIDFETGVDFSAWSRGGTGASSAPNDRVIVSASPSIGQVYHLCMTRTDAVLNLFVDGVLVGSQENPYQSVNSSGYGVGALVRDSNIYSNCTVIDPVFYSRALTLPEIQTLANPADPMLGGLIQPPKRRYYVIKYHPTTARLLTLKQNNRFLSLQKI